MLEGLATSFYASLANQLPFFEFGLDASYIFDLASATDSSILSSSDTSALPEMSSETATVDTTTYDESEEKVETAPIFPTGDFRRNLQNEIELTVYLGALVDPEGDIFTYTVRNNAAFV